MRFTQLSLGNWRNFRGAKVPLQPRTFVVGANASGKSNLLDALRFLRDLAVDGGGLQRAVAERGGLKAIRSLHAGVDNDVEIRVDVADDGGAQWGYQLRLRETRKRKPYVWREVVSRNDVEVLHRKGAVEDDDERLETYLETGSQNREFRELAKFFASIEYVNIVPLVVREQRPTTDRSRAADPHGSDLIERMADVPVKKRKPRLASVSRAISSVVPQLRNIDLKQDDHGRWHLVAGFKHWRGVDARHDEAQFSDGTLRLIGILWSLTGSGGPILLEEPEQSLHEAAIAEIPVMLHRAAQDSGRQVIVSTHSRAMLQDRGIDPSEIVLLELTKSDTLVKLGSADPLLSSLASQNAPFGDEVVAASASTHASELTLPL